jgi:hypothetical protein
MSRLSELHHETAILAAYQPRYTPQEWDAMRQTGAIAAWRDTNLAVSYDTAWRVADAVLRAAMPDRVPEEGR